MKYFFMSMKIHINSSCKVWEQESASVGGYWGETKLCMMDDDKKPFVNWDKETWPGTSKSCEYQKKWANESCSGVNALCWYIFLSCFHLYWHMFDSRLLSQFKVFRVSQLLGVFCFDLSYKYLGHCFMCWLTYYLWIKSQAWIDQCLSWHLNAHKFVNKDQNRKKYETQHDIQLLIPSRNINIDDCYLTQSLDQALKVRTSH